MNAKIDATSSSRCAVELSAVLCQTAPVIPSRMRLPPRRCADVLCSGDLANSRPDPTTGAVAGRTGNDGDPPKAGLQGGHELTA
jgi:hypothetical protein